MNTDSILADTFLILICVHLSISYLFSLQIVLILSSLNLLSAAPILGFRTAEVFETVPLTQIDYTVYANFTDFLPSFY